MGSLLGKFMAFYGVQDVVMHNITHKRLSQGKNAVMRRKEISEPNQQSHSARAQKCKSKSTT